MRTFLHGFHEATDAFAHLVFLGGNAFLVRHQTFVLAEVQNHVGTVKTTDGAADDIAHAVLVLRHDHGFFRLTDLLHEGLFGVLGRNAAEAGRGHFFFNFVTYLGIGFDAPGIKDGNLIMLGNDAVRHNELGKGADVAALLVNVHAEFTSRPDRFLGSRQQSLLNRGHEGLAADAFFPFPKFQSGYKVCIHAIKIFDARGVCIQRTKKSERLLSPTFATLAETSSVYRLIQRR